jgi:signal peptidase II
MKKSSIALLVIFFLVAIDQLSKIWVKTNMSQGAAFPVLGNWFYIFFVENEGMAFGINFGENIGKLMLSLVRVGVVGFLLYYLFATIKREQTNMTVVVILSVIIAGAIGNILDCLFYGMIWNYAPFLYGRVVDMFYFKLFMTPNWVPYFGGDYFFPAIFNVADSCVTVGIFVIIIWNKKFFALHKKEIVEQN